jgi:hypothetical protein
MSAVSRILCGGLAVSALILTASAQEPVQLVRLNVVAVDAQGKPVTDLTAGDLHVVDEGKPQTIALFHAGGWGPATAANPAEFTNRPSPPPHTTVILFDCLNHMRAECVYASKKLGTSLKQVEDAGSIYFYVLTPAGDADPVRPLPAAPGAAPDKTWNQNIEAMLNKEVKGLKPRPSGMSDEVVTKKTYATLENLGKQLTAYPGRRDLVWVVGGIPSIYKENTKNPCIGIWVGCGLYAEHLSAYLDLYGTVVDLLTFTDLDTNKTTDMEAMASLTGGSLTYGNKGGEINQVIQQLNESASAGYVISYDPSAANWDKKFHVVKLTCDRKGVKLIAKTRYYALPDARDAGKRQMDALGYAFASANDQSDIGLRATIAPGKAAGTVKVDLRVDLSDLLLQESGGKYTAHLRVLVSARSAAGPEGDPKDSNLDPVLTKEQRDAYVKDGFPISNEVTIDSTTKVVRLIVGDRVTSLVGSLTIPVAPPK